MDKRNLEFASLLHDIGKFFQRTDSSHDNKFSSVDFGQNGAHAKWSADFINKYFNDDIVDLALFHHNPGKSNFPKLGNMLQKADHHSSAERICSDKNEVKETPLISIFSEININENKQCEVYSLPLKELNLVDDFENIKPKMNTKELMSGWNFVPEYNVLWNKFTEEIEGLNNIGFNTLLALIRKYTSYMPSAAYVSVPDISLYDHSKTTSALATCRYLFDRDSDDKLLKTDNQEVYLAINGAISGIQDFIFKISSPQEAQSGMSKRLRGRSLYLTLITDAISSYIANELELTEANILFCGGGKFTIIAPNTDNVKVKLSNIKEMVNKEFIDKFNAELYFSLVYEECAGLDSKDEGISNLEEFGKVTATLKNKLVEDKKHKFVNNLDDVFNFEDNIKYDDICSVCGNLYDKKNDEDIVCETCKSHEDLGRDVANSNYMLKVFINDNYNFKDAKKDFSFWNENLKIAYSFLKLEGSSSKLANKLDKLDMFVDKFEIIKLNDTNFLEFANEFEDNEKVSFSFSFLGNTVPRYSNKIPLYFEHLAKISKGANKLGILKMDVDNLGLIFSDGFNHIKKNGNGMSISRVSTLSSQMDLFFSGFINKIAENYKIYSNIKGLDDKFNSIELELQDDDTTFTVYKPKFNIELNDEEKLTLKDYSIPTIHINYSGGDDLVVLGPYDDVISFAYELRTKFKEWTCNNNSINLSGGISVVSPKFPIGKAVKMSDNYLNSSKSCGKDKITVFGEVVDWYDDGTGKCKGFNTLFDFAKELETYNFNKKVSSGVIYSMLNMWQNSFKGSFEIPDNDKEWKQLNHKKLSTKRFIPLFKYKLRLISDKKVRSELDKKGIKMMPWIKIPVSWVSLRMR